MWDTIKRVSEQAHRILRRKLSYQECLMDSVGNYTIAGKYLLKDLARFCNVNKSSMVTNLTGSTDPYATAFNEGKRAVYNRIIRSLNMNDEQIHKMYKELDNE